MELFKATKQWSSRPADERFASIQALYDATRAYATDAREKHANVSELRTEAIEGDVQLVGKNHGLASYSDKADTANLLFHSNGSLLLRAFTSEKYARIWNYEVADRLLGLQQQGWEPAMPDIRTTADDFPALYASDHDMFAFIRNRNVVVREPGNPDGLQRGVIVENSEVGASALKLTRFLYREMCGNHIIWGASKVLEISVRHVGDARSRWTSASWWALWSASQAPWKGWSRYGD